MIPEHGIHRAHDIAIACNELRSAVRDLATDGPATADIAAVASSAEVLDAIALSLGRYWRGLRPLLCESCGDHTEPVRDVRGYLLCERCAEGEE